ncbi:MAG: hypothetical protein AB1476_05685 [Candidatus Hadarchaeota archaeon]
MARDAALRKEVGKTSMEALVVSHFMIGFFVLISGAWLLYYSFVNGPLWRHVLPILVLFAGGSLILHFGRCIQRALSKGETLVKMRMPFRSRPFVFLFPASKLTPKKVRFMAKYQRVVGFFLAAVLFMMGVIFLSEFYSAQTRGAVVSVWGVLITLPVFIASAVFFILGMRWRGRLSGLYNGA